MTTRKVEKEEIATKPWRPSQKTLANPNYDFLGLKQLKVGLLVQDSSVI